MRLATALTLLLAGACVAPRPKARPALSPERRAEVERGMYVAVDAYMRADYATARARLDAILAVDPGNRDARDLRRRVLAVERASAPRKP